MYPTPLYKNGLFSFHTDKGSSHDFIQVEQVVHLGGKNVVADHITTRLFLEQRFTHLQVVTTKKIINHILTRTGLHIRFQPSKVWMDPRTVLVYQKNNYIDIFLFYIRPENRIYGLLFDNILRQLFIYLLVFIFLMC